MRFIRVYTHELLASTGFPVEYGHNQCRRRDGIAVVNVHTFIYIYIYKLVDFNDNGKLRPRMGSVFIDIFLVV